MYATLWSIVFMQIMVYCVYVHLKNVALNSEKLGSTFHKS